MRLTRCSLKPRSYSLYFWISITIIILYMEYFSYILNTFNWHSVKCTDRPKCARILLVADPQIIGNKNEAPHFLTPFTIFDSDRYLHVTYQLAFEFVRPDIVIFLGDLMDEGHTASDIEFNNYVRRLFNIFLIHTDAAMYVKHVWLPGDNDIGGEDTVVTQQKVRRFERAFTQPSIFSHHNITFFKINRLTNNIPVYKKNREFYDTSEIFVGLSHVPMMFKPSIFVDKVSIELDI
ncbi:unnamed protein product [Acanthoscelides obtectus]|uniref:Calcineurin-like phosphoesterase domain-containing protein n=1 Tax=Acanthoscelides obtectus TaxID=200917 RepID=A0A9P0P1Y7_ACAOB|nr:unnamed protein product [Acanthoscelides obtectus]CAK1666374.1 Uncharacterized protein C630.12 [Acanthoscelides obtectus]